MIVLISCFWACTKEEIRNLNNNEVKVLGHGGFGFLSSTNRIPPNSKFSIEKALFETDADGIEIDLQLSADGELLLFHDLELELLTSCEGYLFDHDYSSLTVCNYSKEKHGQIIGLDPLLNEIIDQSNCPIIALDTKEFFNEDRESVFEFYDRYLLALEQSLQSFPCLEKVEIQSHKPHFLNDVKASFPEVKTTLKIQNMQAGIELALANDFDGLLIDYDRVRKSDVFAAHQAGLLVSLVDFDNSFELNNALNMHPDCIEVDNIVAASRLLKNR